MADPLTNFPITGYVYDIDRTVENGVTVKVINVRTKESTSTTSNSLGEYSLNLANMTTQWLTNDLLILQAWKLGTPNKIISTTLLVENESIEKNLYLRAVFNKRVVSKLNWNDEHAESFGHEFG
ncbi:MAG: carboxypeptidase-like regulatory domain-containing protein, partial [Candidatus Heimdallarchaeaceae archaeon]